MAAMSNYLEGEVINLIFRTATYTKPATVAIALCTAAPTDASTGATIPEVANSFGYSRVAFGPADANWSAPIAGDGTTQNVTAITFPQASGGNWGTITYVAIVDSTTYGAGNMLFFGVLTTPKTIDDMDIFAFAINQLDIQVDGACP
jgi:hypothetical protein